MMPRNRLGLVSFSASGCEDCVSAQRGSIIRFTWVVAMRWVSISYIGFQLWVCLLASHAAAVPLYAIQNTDSIYQFETTTGIKAVVATGSFGDSSYPVIGMDGFLYAIQSTNSVYRVDLSTGVK